MLTPWKESYDHPKQHIKKQRYCFANKGPSSRGYGFSNSHVWMGELDHKETWVPRNSCFWTVVLEKTLESPLDCKEIQPVHPKGDQSWVFIGRPDVEDEIPTLATWCKELTHLKRPWCWERLRAGGEGDDRGWDDWMASSTWWTWVWVDSGSWWLTGKPGVLRSMGSKEPDTVERLNWTELIHISSEQFWGSLLSLRGQRPFHMFFPHDCHLHLLWQLHFHVHESISKGQGLFWAGE